ncbi:hypothetical protein DL96DRAFT_1666441 [Flagelloscypha sp. PMI_526]|nr:hypothetical protein DL96DRAFT_1666441 [Flagelloscypha sp. PMI_526]
MFRCSRPLFQALKVKSTTGLVGLEVHPNPLPTLAATYSATLDVLQDIPVRALYRQSVEAIVRNKLNVAEKQLDEGTYRTLQLAKKMLTWKAWEPLEESAPAGQWDYPQ